MLKMKAYKFMLKLRKSTVSRFSTVEGENMAVSGFLPSRPFRVKQHDAVKKAAAKKKRWPNC